MSQEIKSTPVDTVQSTDVRFSLRSLLILMSVVALLSAAIGPYFRGMDPSKQVRVASLWGVCFLFAATQLGRLARRRYLLEKAAGNKLVELRPGGRYLQRAQPWLVYPAGGLLIAFGLLWQFLDSQLISLPSNNFATLQNWYRYLFLLFLYGWLSGTFIARGVATIWWNRTIQLREHGVLHGVRLLRWNHITDCRWSRWTSNLSIEGVDQRHNDARLDILLPANHVEAVAAILADKLSEIPESRIPDLSMLQPRTVPLFKLTTRWNVSSRGCLGALACYTGLVAIEMLLGGFQSRVFAYGCFGGFMAGVGIVAIGRYQTRWAGPPRIRLDAWLDWPMLLLRIAIAAACFLIGIPLTPASTWLSVALGLCYGVALISGMGLVARDKLDLCENGVVIRRWMFWPWHAIRAASWHRSGNNRLVFRRGWQRIVAVVPPEQREAVDALLQEKLGEKFQP
jgi:hypothetical protein